MKPWNVVTAILLWSAIIRLACIHDLLGAVVIGVLLLVSELVFIAYCIGKRMGDRGDRSIEPQNFSTARALGGYQPRPPAGGTGRSP